MKKLIKGLVTTSFIFALLFGSTTSTFASILDQPDVPKVRSIKYTTEVSTLSLDEPDVPKVR